MNDVPTSSETDDWRVVPHLEDFEVNQDGLVRTHIGDQLVSVPQIIENGKAAIVLRHAVTGEKQIHSIDSLMMDTHLNSPGGARGSFELVHQNGDPRDYSDGNLYWHRIKTISTRPKPV